MFVDRGGLTLVVIDPAHDAWQVTLDRIELDVIRAELALAHGTDLRVDQWDVPGPQGPVPTALQARAHEILARQEAVLEQLADRLGDTSRQQAVVDRVDRASGRRHVPAYVDVSA